MPESTPNYAVLPPAAEPDRVGRRVFEMLLEVVRDKSALGLHDKWTRNYRLGRNRPWPGRTPAGLPLSSANFLHVHRQRTVNTLTDNHPTFNVARMGDAAHDDAYRALERLAAHWWNEQEQQAVLERSVINGETYGVAVEKVVFDPELEYGLGEARTVVVDPFHFGLYPVNCLDVQEAEAVLHFYPMSLRRARRRWPEAAGRIKADGALLAELNDTRREAAAGGSPEARSGFTARFGDVVRTLVNASGGTGVPDDEVLVCECWTRDYAMDGNGPVHPGCIRCTTVCNGGSMVLDDRGNPSINPALAPEEAAKTYLFDKYPFVLTNSITDTSSLWGMSDFEQLDTLQREINKCLSQLTYHKDRCARPKIVNPRDSGVHNSAFNNRLGVINPSSMASAQGIRYLEFANNTNDIQAVLRLYKDLFFQVAGSHELEQAREQAHPVIAYKAVAALLEQAATMMRGKIRNYSRLIRERGRMFLSHAQNWYTEERWITCRQGGKTGARAVRADDLRIPARLTVVSGSTMPVSQVQRREEALALYEMGAVDRRDLLEKLDWAGWSETVERMDAEQASDPEDGRAPV